ncbi:LOW QUALITY PROTEIN: hypothetical protein J0S82_012400, partial [Galemys pyrenaicus]
RFTKFGDPDFLQRKEENVVKFCSGGTHLDDTKLDIQGNSTSTEKVMAFALWIQREPGRSFCRQVSPVPTIATATRSTRVGGHFTPERPLPRSRQAPEARTSGDDQSQVMTNPRTDHWTFQRHLVLSCRPLPCNADVPGHYVDTGMSRDMPAHSESLTWRGLAAVRMRQGLPRDPARGGAGALPLTDPEEIKKGEKRLLKRL